MIGLSLRRWIARRRHGGGPWGALLARPPQGEWVSLDLETTGLDTARDHILTIAAVPVSAGRIRLAERFEVVVKPAGDAARVAGIDAIRHHRLRPQDLAHGVAVHEAVARLLDWLGPRTLIGYRIGFDVAMLDRVVPAIAGFRLPNPRIDIAAEFLVRAGHRRPGAALDTTSFENIAAALGVPMLGRHTALGDAITAAACWLALRARG